MATRPWVTPDEVRAYSDRESVINRTDEKLAIDIMRAEQYIISYTRRLFEDDEEFPTIPEPVKIAVILIAEAYAAYAVDFSNGSGTYKSESFDDYSYTLADTEDIIGNLDLASLLEMFILADTKNTVTMRMRKL